MSNFYTVNPTTHQVVKNGTNLGLPHADGFDAIQAAFDDCDEGDTITLLAGVHNIIKPVPYTNNVPGVTSLIHLLDNVSFDVYTNHIVSIFEGKPQSHILIVRKNITLQGEMQGSNWATTVVGNTDDLIPWWWSDGVAEIFGDRLVPGGRSNYNAICVSCNPNLTDDQKKDGRKGTIKNLVFKNFAWDAVNIFATTDIIGCKFENCGGTMSGWIDNRLTYPNLAKVNDVWNKDFSNPVVHRFANNTVTGCRSCGSHSQIAEGRCESNRFEGFAAYPWWPYPDASFLVYDGPGWSNWIPRVGKSLGVCPVDWGTNMVVGFVNGRSISGNYFSGKFSEANKPASPPLWGLITIYVGEDCEAKNIRIENNVFEDFTSNRAIDVTGFYFRDSFTEFPWHDIAYPEPYSLSIIENCTIRGNSFRRIGGAAMIFDTVNADKFTGLKIMENEFIDFTHTYGTYGYPNVAMILVKYPEWEHGGISDYTIYDNMYKHGNFSTVDDPDFCAGLLLDVVNGYIEERPIAFYQNGNFYDYFLLTALTQTSTEIVLGGPPGTPMRIKTASPAKPVDNLLKDSHSNGHHLDTSV